MAERQNWHDKSGLLSFTVGIGISTNYHIKLDQIHVLNKPLITIKPYKKAIHAQESTSYTFTDCSAHYTLRLRKKALIASNFSGCIVTLI